MPFSMFIVQHEKLSGDLAKFPKYLESLKFEGGCRSRGALVEGFATAIQVTDQEFSPRREADLLVQDVESCRRQAVVVSNNRHASPGASKQSCFRPSI